MICSGVSGQCSHTIPYIIYYCICYNIVICYKMICEILYNVLYRQSHKYTQVENDTYRILYRLSFLPRCMNGGYNHINIIKQLVKCIYKVLTYARCMYVDHVVHTSVIDWYLGSDIHVYVYVLSRLIGLRS